MQEWPKFEPHTKNYTDTGIFEKNAFLRPQILEKWHFRDHQIPNNMAFLKPLHTKIIFQTTHLQKMPFYDLHLQKGAFSRPPLIQKSNVHPNF